MDNPTAPRPTLTERAAAYGITATARPEPAPLDGEWAKLPGSTHWTVTLANPATAETLTVPFHMGALLTGEPTAADVLNCLLSDATFYDNASSFEDWAHELSIDTDSRTAEAEYRDAGESADQVRAFLGDAYDAFAYETEAE